MEFGLHENKCKIVRHLSTRTIRVARGEAKTCAQTDCTKSQTDLVTLFSLSVQRGHGRSHHRPDAQAVFVDKLRRKLVNIRESALSIASKGLY